MIRYREDCYIIFIHLFHPSIGRLIFGRSLSKEMKASIASFCIVFLVKQGFPILHFLVPMLDNLKLRESFVIIAVEMMHSGSLIESQLFPISYLLIRNLPVISWYFSLVKMILTLLFICLLKKLGPIGRTLQVQRCSSYICFYALCFHMFMSICIH